jgi:hypothetical protein
MAPQVMMMIPHMKRKPPTKQRETRKSAISPPIMLSFNYNHIPSSMAHTSVPLAKVLILMEQTIINGRIA